MRLGNYELRFSLFPWLAALVFFALLAKLGFWQLSRAEEKRQILAELVQASEAASVELKEIDGDLRAWSYRRIVARGKLDLSRQFLLDNQVVDDRVGFHVLTPLDAAGKTILLDRGFVPIDGDRSRLPEIDAGCDAVTFPGTVYVPTAGFRLGGIDAPGQDDWPRVVQYLDPEAMSARLGRPLAPVVLRLDPGADCGYRREWRWVSSQPMRHTAYAVQWFALAATVLVLFLVLSIRKR